MFDFENDMKMAFLEEAQALIDQTEASFMALDGGDRSPELIDQIFRLAHNFKGSAKTVGLQHLSDFGHVFEDVLTKIKDGTLIPDKPVCTVLLKTLDHFRSYVDGLKVDLEYQHDVIEITATLRALTGHAVDHVADRGDTTPSAVEVPAASTTEIPKAMAHVDAAGTPSRTAPIGKPAEDEIIIVQSKTRTYPGA